MALLIADIPGLIEGASEGKGLGDAFLRHIERTAVVLHLIDAYTEDPAASYLAIRAELSNYSQAVAALPEVVALTKTEGLDDEVVDMQLENLRAVVPENTQVMAISSQAHVGLQELLRELVPIVQETRELEYTQLDEEVEEDVPVISLTGEQARTAWATSRDKDVFVVTGEKIEKFARRTDPENIHSVNRFRDIMKKMGIHHQLVREGAHGDSQVRVGELEITLLEQ
jgi:GTP-binding protein